MSSQIPIYVGSSQSNSSVPKSLQASPPPTSPKSLSPERIRMCADLIKEALQMQNEVHIKSRLKEIEIRREKITAAIDAAQAKSLETLKINREKLNSLAIVPDDENLAYEKEKKALGEQLALLIREETRIARRTPEKVSAAFSNSANRKELEAALQKNKKELQSKYEALEQKMAQKKIERKKEITKLKELLALEHKNLDDLGREKRNELFRSEQAKKEIEAKKKYENLLYDIEALKAVQNLFKGVPPSPESWTDSDVIICTKFFERKISEFAAKKQKIETEFAKWEKDIRVKVKHGHFEGLNLDASQLEIFVDTRNFLLSKQLAVKKMREELKELRTQSAKQINDFQKFIKTSGIRPKDWFEKFDQQSKAILELGNLIEQKQQELAPLTEDTLNKINKFNAEVEQFLAPVIQAKKNEMESPIPGLETAIKQRTRALQTIGDLARQAIAIPASSKRKAASEIVETPELPATLSDDSGNGIKRFNSSLLANPPAEANAAQPEPKAKGVKFAPRPPKRLRT